MAGTGVGKFSSTAGSNTSNLTVNFAENMAPSNVNNAARELMGHIRDMYEQLGDGYFEFGDGDGEYTVARSDADTITITSSADISSVYFAGRKIRITDGGANVVEGTIASSSHTSTTQTVNLTGISLASGAPTKVELGVDTAAFGGRIILDDDGDTYIEAVTDDTIDIYVAGAKDFVITANTFTAESGSTIAAQTISAAGNVDFNGDLDVDGTTNLDVVDIDGAVDMASTLTVTGAAILNGGIDVAGDITLDAAGNQIFFKDSGTTVGTVSMTGSDLKFISNVNDKDIIFAGTDNNSEVVALTLDMSAAGAAAFNAGITANAGVVVDNITIDGTEIDLSSGDLTLDVAGDIILDADGGDIKLRDAGSGFARFTNSSSDLIIQVDENDKDIVFKGEDGGSAITPLRIDMSESGKVLIGGTGATFGELGITGAGNGDANIDLYASVGSGSIGKAEIFFSTDSSSDHVSIASIVAQQPSGDQASRKGEIVFNTADNAGPAARMTIQNNGNVGIGNTSPGNTLSVEDSVNAYTASFKNNKNPSSAAPFGVTIRFHETPDNGTSEFLRCDDSVGSSAVARLIISSEGDITNHDNSYGQLSDERIKDNIVDANSQWDDIKAIKVRNFERKDDINQYGAGNKVQIGVIAQEIEQVSPGLVKESDPTADTIEMSSEFGTLYTANDPETQDGIDEILWEEGDDIPADYEVGSIRFKAVPPTKNIGDVKSLSGEKLKKVAYSVLYMKAIKALQEAMTRIETLEAKVTELEG